MSRSRKAEYSGYKRWYRGCRNHGDCSYCSDGRQFFDRKRRQAADNDLDWLEENEQTSSNEVK